MKTNFLRKAMIAMTVALAIGSTAVAQDFVDGAFGHIERRRPGHGGGYNPEPYPQYPPYVLGYTLFKTVHGPQVYLSYGDRTYCWIDTEQKLNHFLSTYRGRIPAPVYTDVPAGMSYRGVCWF